jgi:hypothetical protein
MVMNNESVKLELPGQFRSLCAWSAHIVRRLFLYQKLGNSLIELENIKGRINLNNCFVVDGDGKGGGLALYWDDSIKLSILSYGLHHIDMLIWDGTHHAAGEAPVRSGVIR